HSRFTFFMCYYPTMHHWQEDLNLYKDLNVQYLYMHGFHADKNDWKVEMESYIGSKMMWNPNQDAEALRREFIKYYYRELADYVEEYVLNFDLQMKEIVSRDDSPDMTLQGLDEILSSKYYSVPFFETQLGLIDTMYEVVNSLDLSKADKKTYKIMVDRLKLSAQFMLLYHYDDYYYNDYWGKKAMMDDFFSTCTNLEIRNWREFNGSLSTLKTLFGYTD
ncbi:MAG: DUF4838 domain-containing protein, partial [Clostridia bacterium]|nr:DUF4838 domain-containing protein [Clostridia bacterium]